jgi:nucleoside-diphosphate-sugar epimerase
MNAQEILVTGGTGTLGRRVVDRLRAAGREVRVLSRSGSPGTVRGDLSTGENLEAAVRGVDTIVHCASNPLKPRRTDVAGTELLLQEAARAVREGAQLCPQERYGTVRWEEFLREKFLDQQISRGPVGEGTS